MQASFDDVLAIAGFGVCLALAAGSEATAAAEAGSGSDSSVANGSTLGSSQLAQPSLAWLILKAPVELIAGT